MTRQGQAGVSAEAVAKLVAKWRGDAISDTAKMREMSLRMQAGEKIVVESVSGYVDPRTKCADELEAIATAPPEQASQKQPCDCQQLCERLTNPLPLGRFCMADAAQEKMRAEPPQAGWQPQAVSAGALDTLDKQARALAEELVVFAHDEDEETGGEWFSVVKAIPLIVKALAAHDQKVRAEVCEQAAQLVDKAFEQSWVVQDTLDAIRSLASGAEKKK